MCPVIVVRGAERNRQGVLGRVVVGVGGPTGSASAVRFAVREAEARGCDLTAVRAWRGPANEPVDHMLIADDAARLREERASAGIDDALREIEQEHPRVDIHHQTVEGPAHHVLLDATAEADLVVVGALRRHGRFGLQLGTVAHTLLHHSECPVAVIPQPV